MRTSERRGRVAAGVILACGVVASALFAVYGPPDFGRGEARDETSEMRTIDLTEWDLEIADTLPARQAGLSGRASLGDNAGMLFVFPASGRHAFWMKDMRFSLDIIWISDGIVVDVVTLPPPYPGLPIPPSHTPDEDADVVLELNAGMAEALGIREGVRLAF